MKKMKIPAVLATCAACVLSLFGCGKEHILDGPGMVNDLTWTEFTVTRSDSYAQYNFWFTVEYRESGFFLTLHREICTKVRCAKIPKMVK